MKSKANLKGHPVHPMLIPFPIAFLIGGFLFDLAGMIKQDQYLWDLGIYLSFAGIITALAAAVPGLIDYLFTVPPDSSAKKRATKHGLINVSSVTIFCIALIIKDKEIEHSAWVIALELIGIILLGIGGWLGGTLVYRNQIGVDPRYAHAGKWKEEEFTQEGNSPLMVGQANELKTNQMKLLKINGKRIVLSRTEKGYSAFEDRCSHRGGSLAGGAMICETVQCPWHGSQFDVNTGTVKAGPAQLPIKTYKVNESNEKIFLHL